MALPELRLTDGAPTGAPALALAVRGGDGGPQLTAFADLAAGLVGADPLDVVRRSDGKGEPGEVHVVPLPAARDGLTTVYLVGVGDGSPSALRKAAAGLARRAKDEPALASALAHGQGPDGVRAVAEATLLASYGYTLKSQPKPRRLERVDLLVDDPAPLQPALERAQRVAEAVGLARDLVNTPSLEKTPQWLADQAVAAAARSGLTVRVRDEEALRAEGFGGVLAVGMGSDRPPRLIELQYDGGEGPHVVLVGKGITFDTGGLSLKPNDSMVSMKTDMAGGAAVIATMSALGALGVRARVTGLVPAAENMPSGSAQRPSDVIRHYGGRTVEVLNTDAEGRLVLADALAYADTRLAADVIVDLATLTGAASLALGKRHGALYATTEELATGLLGAAEAAGERLWRMPLVDDYRFALESEVADLRNIGDPDTYVSAGSIVAALFLREFTGGRPWAHLDIAGPGRSDADEDEVTKGGTGFGVRTLLRWLAP